VDALARVPRPRRARNDQQCRPTLRRRAQEELWLFSDTQGGARASANLYSLLLSAKANGLEPRGYLRYVFERLPAVTDVDEFEQLLPWRVDRKQILFRALGDVS
jgi:hypothetical protein